MGIIPYLLTIFITTCSYSVLVAKIFPWWNIPTIKDWYGLPYNITFIGRVLILASSKFKSIDITLA